MDLNVLCIFASLLLVSVGASRYDQGPQKFYDVSSDSATSEQNDNKEVILYLTPDQVRALEAGGAVVRPAEDPENDEADPEFPAEEQVNEDQEEEEQDENEDAQAEEEESQQEEQETPEYSQNQDIDFEEILKILNEQQVEEEEEAAEEQARNEPQVEEENTEAPRNFSPRITLRQQQQQKQQQEQRYLAPAIAKKEQILKSYSYIRYQPNEQPQRVNIQLLQQQQEEASEAEESNEEPQTEAPAQGRKKYKLIPYEVEETPEESTQEQNAEEQAQQNSEAENDAQRLTDLVTPLFGAGRMTEALSQRKNRLLQNELRLQSILRELKASPKYNDQKYAIEIEKLKAKLEKQNTASKVELITKAAPALIKQQLSKKRLPSKSNKQGKGSARDAESQQAKPQQPKSQRNSASSENVKPIPVPVIKMEKTEAQKLIPVPVETDKRVSVKNVYVRTRTDRPYIASRKVPLQELKLDSSTRQKLVEIPKSKPERITILRHIWEH